MKELYTLCNDVVQGTESVDSEVIGVGSVLTMELEVEQWIREVRLKVDVDGVRALEVASVDMFAQCSAIIIVRLYFPKKKDLYLCS